MAEDEVNLEDLQDMIDQLEGINRDEVIEPELLAWMREVSDPEFDMVNSLVLVFLNNMKKHDISNSILRSLRLLSAHVPDLIVPQLKHNAKFPVALARYIAETPVKQLEGDGFVLLTMIFQMSSFKSVSDENFINNLFNSLGFIKDEDIFNSIVDIIISLAQDCSEQVYRLGKANEGFRYFIEALLQIFNKSKGNRYHLILVFVIGFQETLKNESVFYTSDLKIFIDILLRNLANIEYQNDAPLMMKALYQQLQTDAYKKVKYKSSDMREIYDELQISSDHSQEVMEIFEKIINSNLI